MIIKEIRDKYKKLHDKLSTTYYSGKSRLTKEKFDLQHGKIWSDMDAEIKTASDYIPPKLERNLEKEIDELKVIVDKLIEAKNE